MYCLGIPPKPVPKRITKPIQRDATQVISGIDKANRKFILFTAN